MLLSHATSRVGGPGWFYISLSACFTRVLLSKLPLSAAHRLFGEAPLFIGPFHISLGQVQRSRRLYKVILVFVVSRHDDAGVSRMGRQYDVRMVKACSERMEDRTVDYETRRPALMKGNGLKSAIFPLIYLHQVGVLLCEESITILFSLS